MLDWPPPGPAATPPAAPTMQNSGATPAHYCTRLWRKRPTKRMPFCTELTRGLGRLQRQSMRPAHATPYHWPHHVPPVWALVIVWLPALRLVVPLRNEGIDGSAVGQHCEKDQQALAASQHRTWHCTRPRRCNALPASVARCNCTAANPWHRPLRCPDSACAHPANALRIIPRAVLQSIVLLAQRARGSWPIDRHCPTQSPDSAGALPKSTPRASPTPAVPADRSHTIQKFTMVQPKQPQMFPSWNVSRRNPPRTQHLTGEVDHRLLAQGRLPRRGLGWSLV